MSNSRVGVAEWLKDELGETIALGDLKVYLGVKDLEEEQEILQRKQERLKKKLRDQAEEIKNLKLKEKTKTKLLKSYKSHVNNLEKEFEDKSNKFEDKYAVIKTELEKMEKYFKSTKESEKLKVEFAKDTALRTAEKVEAIKEEVDKLQNKISQLDESFHKEINEIEDFTQDLKTKENFRNVINKAKNPFLAVDWPNVRDELFYDLLNIYGERDCKIFLREKKKDLERVSKEVIESKDYEIDYKIEMSKEITKAGLSKNYDTIIVGSGDSFFNYPVQLTKDRDKEVVLISKEKRTSRSLQDKADEVIYL